MQKCPRCGFTSVSVRRVLDDDGKDRGSATICSNCDSVLRDDVDMVDEAD